MFLMTFSIKHTRFSQREGEAQTIALLLESFVAITVKSFASRTNKWLITHVVTRNLTGCLEYVCQLMRYLDAILFTKLTPIDNIPISTKHDGNLESFMHIWA